MQGLAGEKPALELPHLKSLQLSKLKQGEVVLSCPNVADLWIFQTEHLRINVRKAAFKALDFIRCWRFMFTLYQLKISFRLFGL